MPLQIQDSRRQDSKGAKAAGLEYAFDRDNSKNHFMQQAVLCMTLEPGTRRFVIEGDECTIGTGSDCDIVIEEISVSRRHARIKRENQGWLLEDLDSTNGTRINDCRIEKSASFEPGDRLQFGNVRAELRLEDAAEFEVAAGQPDAPPPGPFVAWTRFLRRWPATGWHSSSLPSCPILSPGCAPCRSIRMLPVSSTVCRK